MLLQPKQFLNGGFKSISRSYYGSSRGLVDALPPPAGTLHAAADPVKEKNWKER